MIITQTIKSESPETLREALRSLNRLYGEQKCVSWGLSYKDGTYEVKLEIESDD